MRQIINLQFSVQQNKNPKKNKKQNDSKYLYVMMGQYHNAKQGAVRYNGNLKVLYKLKTVTCGCLGWGSQIPILTAYLESEGFFLLV